MVCLSCHFKKGNFKCGKHIGNREPISHVKYSKFFLFISGVLGSRKWIEQKENSKVFTHVKYNRCNNTRISQNKILKIFIAFIARKEKKTSITFEQKEVIQHQTPLPASITIFGPPIPTPLPIVGYAVEHQAFRGAEVPKNKRI